jgi:hypothetical protein
MKRVCLLGALLFACGDTVSLGDGRPKSDSAAPGHFAEAGVDSGSGGAHDGAPADVAHEPPSWKPCAGRACNEPCHVCDPADPQCVEPPDPHRCDAHGECTPHSVTCS